MDWSSLNISACDLETSGKITHLDPDTKEPTSAYALQPWRLSRGDAWITSASMLRRSGDSLERHVSQLFPDRLIVKDMLQWVVDTEATVLGWNIAFDIAFLMAFGPDIEDLCLRIRWLDGMLLERHYDIEPEYEFATAKHKKKSYALKGTTEKPGAMQRWLPHVPLHNEGVKFHSTDPADLARLQTYNDQDNLYTYVIAMTIWEKLTLQQRKAAMIEAEALPMVAQANLYGLTIDRLTVRHLSAKLDMDAAALLAELADDGMTEEIVRSPDKLGKLMFDQWQLPVLKKNKSKVEGKEDTRSTDKEVLHELAFIDGRARKVKAYREALNAKGKFCTSVIDSLDYNDDGCSHPVARIFATYTGRQTVASKQGRGKSAAPIGFALHQMMRGKEYREIVTCPEGYDLFEVDAAGQEFRWMATASGDQTMLGMCMPGEDAHSYMGAAIMGIPYRQLIMDYHAGAKAAEDNRYLGKFANLGCQYRTSARKLRSKARVDYNIPLEMPAAQRIHKTYQTTYPGVPAYWERQIAMVKQLGYVETFGGNRVAIVGDWNGTWGWSMGSTAINYRIQGSGADQKHLAMMVIKDYLRQVGGRFLFELHDGIYGLLPTSISHKAILDIKQMLDNLPYQQAWGFTPPIPMPWDAKLGKAWGRMKEITP